MPPASPAPNALDAKTIYAPVLADLEQVKESLASIMTPETETLGQAIFHALKDGGKLLRPVLTLLVSGASGGISSAHVEAAAVAELIHVATLLHDDVLDDADLRRGRPTVRAGWGNHMAILGGDYLLAQASLKLSYLDNPRLVRIFAIVLSQLCEGEVLQMQNAFDFDTPWSRYYQKSICKTAALFRACCESAGVINRLPEDQIDALKTYGESFGLAFQIVDDLMDFTRTREELGKPVLEDLKSGIINAPVLLTRDYFAETPEKQQALKDTLEALYGLDESAPELPEKAAQLSAWMTEADALNKTVAMAQDYAQKARQSIAFLPESPYKASLLGLLDYALARTH